MKKTKLPRFMLLVRLRGFIDRLFGNYAYDKSTHKFTSPYITAVTAVINTLIPQKREKYAERIYSLSEDVTQTCIDLDHLPESAGNSTPQQKRAAELRNAIRNELYKRYSTLHRELSNETIAEEEEIHELAAHVNLIIANYMRGFNLLSHKNKITTEDFPFLNELDKEKIHTEFMNIRSGEYVRKALDHVSRELENYEG